MNDSSYDKQFYDQQVAGSLASAEVILAILFRAYRPKSVVDFGCGHGAWLLAAEHLGAETVVGFDGSWVDSRAILSSRIEFHPTDFQRELQLDRKFDLALSVEVAEHLPPERASWFVDQLCEASDVIVFGAAIPNQGGTRHINEQWPTYWYEKFSKNGFAGFDVFRPLIWTDDTIDWWYRQNTILYVNRRSDYLVSLPKDLMMNLPILDLAHPILYSAKARSANDLWTTVNAPTARECLGVIRNFAATVFKRMIGR